MCKKSVLVIFLIAAISGAGQNRTITWQGTDSMEITFWKEAKNMHMFIRQGDTAALPGNDSLNKFLDGLKITADQKKDFLDTISRLETRKDSLFISIQKFITVPDNPSEAASLSVKKDRADESSKPGFPFMMIILYLLTGILIGLGIPYFTEWIRQIYRWMRRKLQINNLGINEEAEGDIPNGQTMNTTIQYILPALLAEKITNKINLKKPDEGARFIVGEFDRLKGDLSSKENDLQKVKADLDLKVGEFESKRKEAEDLAMQLKQAGGMITELSDKIEELNTRISDQASFYKEFNELAESAVSRYYTELVITLEKNKNIEKEEKEKLILRNMITFAVLCVSLLKKQIRDAGPMDQMNIDMLKGEQPEPAGTITENSPSNSDALAYYIFHLLKGHGVSKLENVLIHGFKIGK